ncbi:GAF domain-containing protein [candidate division KSB1 bacterium]|nr:GAF domain-containing protein [candidate division KSB1 bacterium]
MLNRANDTNERSKLINEKALSLLQRCIQSRNIDEALRIITNEACVLVGGKGGSVWLRSSEDLSKIFLRWTYRPNGANRIGQSYYTNKEDDEGYYDGLTGWVFATGKPLCIKDITDKDEITKYPKIRWRDKYGGFEVSKDKEKQKHFLAAPIFSCRVKNEVIGVIRIGSSKAKKPFDLKDLELLKIYSGYISGLLTDFLKREEEKKLIERLFTVASLRDLELLLDEAAKVIPIVIDGSYSSIFLKDKDGNFCLETSSAPHLHESSRRYSDKLCLKYRPGEGKTGRVASTGVSVRVSGNIASEAGKNPSLCEDGVYSSAFLCSAIKDEGGAPVGVIRVVRDLEFGGEFDEDDEKFLESFGQKLYKCLFVHGYFAKGSCFIIMPFETELDDLYKNIIKPSDEKFDFICRREDEFVATGYLSTGIVSHIANANFIIAEVTENNPNVYYELGIAHTLEKVVILLSQKDVPSDIRHWKYLKYRNTIGDAEKLKSNLEMAIREIAAKAILAANSNKKLI